MGNRMPTAVVSGRVDEMARQKADIAMRKAGLTPTEVIQNVWSVMARTGEVPEIARPAPDKEKGKEAIKRLERLLELLPPVNPTYAHLSDDEILALKVREHA